MTTHIRRRLLAGVAAAMSIALPSYASAATTSATTSTPAAHGARSANIADTCGVATPGFARCFAEIRTDVRDGYDGPTGSGTPDGIAAF